MNLDMLDSQDIGGKPAKAQYTCKSMCIYVYGRVYEFPTWFRLASHFQNPVWRGSQSRRGQTNVEEVIVAFVSCFMQEPLLFFHCSASLLEI